MICKMVQHLKNCITGIVIAAILISSLSGCSSNRSSQVRENGLTNPAIKAIVNISTDEDAESSYIRIQGNQELTYSSVKQESPPGVVFYFPDTKLQVPSDYLTPDSKVVQSVAAAELTEKGLTSRIEIALSEDVPFEISREGTTITVSFKKKDARAASKGNPRYPTSSPATRIETVYATKLEDGLKVFVEADGTITNYKSYTIETPARIIFELFGVSSPYRNEKQVPVNTEWVKQVRYYGYPDRLKLVLDTEKTYLSNFTAQPVNNGLVIYLGKNPDRMAAKDLPSSVRSSNPATRLQSVYATQIPNGIMVTVRTDGTITNYQSSITDNPPNIIFDIPNVTNPYETEESFPVNTQWVSRVRHVSYGDKLRLFIETQPTYLSSFSAQPYPNGLIIKIGKGYGDGRIPDYFTAQSDKQPVIERKKPLSVDTEQPAIVNRVEFRDEDAGKTTLIIGTTRPVTYDIRQVGEKKLELILNNTKLPETRRRPLITSRFESAVDRITPLSAKDKNTIFNIELKESVPYFVEENNETLMVHFEASSISPQPIQPIDEPVVKAPTEPYSDRMASLKPEPQPSQPEVQPQPPQPEFQPPIPLPPKQPEFQPPTPLPPRVETKPAPVSAPTTISDTYGDQTPVAETGEKYTGEKIALDFYETDIKNVFRILREVSGKNFAIDNDVTGKVTLSLEHPVPWDQVLDLILKMNKLGKTYEGNIIRIATVKTLQEEEKTRQEKLSAERTLQEQKKALEPVDTEYIPVNYSKAGQEILPHIKEIITKDPPGRASVSVDERTNTIIITDTAEKRKQARQIVEKLDRVTPQVIIEARIVEATANFSKEIGTRWGAGGGVQSTSLLTGVSGMTPEVTGAVDKRVGVGPERGYDVFGGTYGYNMAVNLPAANVGTLGFNFMRIAGTPLLLNAQLMAMESRGEGKLISAPKIVTLDNKQASIKQGLRYPYNKLDPSGNTTTVFEEIDLVLDVIPHVTADNRISMTINITKRDLGSVINNQQSFTTKEAKTELLVNDGDTIVIGGIIKSSERGGETGLPGLSKIPVIGWLFRSRTKSEDKEELLIFITPRIVQLEQKVAHF